MLEIEKRYKLKGDIPEDQIKSKIFIEQSYFQFNPDLRIRKTVANNEEKYFHTVKYKTENKNSKIEIEHPISKEQYDLVFKYINKKPIQKDRYIVDIGNGLYAEVDKFLDTGDVVVEVEFDSEEQMNEFQKPDWIGTEIKSKYSLNYSVFMKINNTDNLTLTEKMELIFGS